MIKRVRTDVIIVRTDENYRPYFGLEIVRISAIAIIRISEGCTNTSIVRISSNYRPYDLVRISEKRSSVFRQTFRNTDDRSSVFRAVTLVMFPA